MCFIIVLCSVPDLARPPGGRAGVADTDTGPGEMLQLPRPSGWSFAWSLPPATSPGPAQSHLLSPQVGNLGLLFMLLFFIYAALGVELFGKLGE